MEVNHPDAKTIGNVLNVSFLFYRRKAARMLQIIQELVSETTSGRSSSLSRESSASRGLLADWDSEAYFLQVFVFAFDAICSIGRRDEST